jgi:hypothetical protein
MAYVQIPKDLKKVKTKVAFNLTKRQIIGFCVAGVVSCFCISLVSFSLETALFLPWSALFLVFLFVIY